MPVIKKAEENFWSNKKPLLKKEMKQNTFKTQSNEFLRGA